MILFLTGPNEFALKKTLDNLVQRFTTKFGDAGLERVSGDSLEPMRLAELLQGASLFAPQRLVVLKNAAANKALWEVLGDWLSRVPTETTLIVVEPAADKRTRTYKELIKAAEVQEFAELQPPELATWLQKTATEQGGAIDAKTAAYLVSRVGVDQWRLWQELQKLISHAPAITTEAVDQLVEFNPQASVFELLDAVLARKSTVMHELLAKLSVNEDPYKLFGLLVSQVHTLAVVQSAGDKSPDAIAKDGAIHPFVVRKMQAVARGMRSGELRTIIESIALLDIQLKSTGVDPWMLVRQSLGKIVARG